MTMINNKGEEEDGEKGLRKVWVIPDNVVPGPTNHTEMQLCSSITLQSFLKSASNSLYKVRINF